MKIFDPWNAPICDEAEVVDTPVGEICVGCGTPILAGDQGHLLPPEDTPIHRECLYMSVVGDARHLSGECSCYGGDDPVNLNRTPEQKREEALFVWDTQHVAYSDWST